MIITRKCEVPEMLDDYIQVIIPNDYRLDSDQVDGKPIRRDGVIVGKMEWASNDYIYGVLYNGKALFGGDLSKAEFTYDVEVERK